MTLLKLYELAQTHLKKEYPSWNPDLINKAALSYAAVESGLSKKILNPNSISINLRNICESTGVQISNGGLISNLLFEFKTESPIIEERVDTEKDTGKKIVSKIMKGTMVYPTRSENFRRYLKTELRKAAPTMEGKPVQKDHSFSVNDTFGTIESVKFIESSGKTKYEARVDPDDPVTKKIESGFVKNVSIGYKAGKMECSICGEAMGWFHDHVPGFKYDDEIAEAIPRDMVYNHLGVVSFPGVSGTSAGVESGEVVEKSVNESMLVLMTEGFEPYYTQITESMKNGVMNMSNNEGNNKEAYETALKAEKLKLQNEQLENKLKEANEKHEKFVSETKATELKNLIEQVLESEMKLNKLEAENVNTRRSVLEKMSKELLQARFDIFAEEIKNRQDIEDSKPKSPKSKIFSQNENLPTQRQEYSGRQVRELQLEWLGSKLFRENYKPTVSAVSTLDDWDHVKQEWKRPLKEFII